MTDTEVLRRSHRYLLALIPSLALIGFVSIARGEATFQQLRGFVSGPASPEGELFDSGDGYLYGTTFQGGTNSVGTIYRIRKDDGSFNIVHSFDSNCRFGCFPRSGVILAPDGFLYGSTASGGLNGVGTLYRIKADGGSFRTIYDFKITDGVGPQADLIFAADGYLYGTTTAGGSSGRGTVFRVKINGSSLTTIHHFSGSDGSVPQSSLILATDGYLYGTTLFGGPNDFGTVFRVKPDGTSFNTIHSFTGSDGAHPKARVTFFPGEYVYGTTSSGGPSQAGTLFRMKPDGSSFSTLYAFNGSDGRTPSSALIVASDGNFYGSTLSGGPGDRGTIFRINPDATSFEIVYAFSDCSDGCAPQNITFLDGYFYGTTAGNGAAIPGAIFRVMPDGTSFSIIHDFSFCEGGCYPQSGTILGSDGILYGTTFYGGPSGFGTIFKINPDGTSFDIVHGFTGEDGSFPASGVTPGPDGFLYGTTPGGASTNIGTIFKVKTDGTSFTNIYSFMFCGDGCNPQAGLTLAADGFLYGTTFSGGLTFNGTVFRVSPDGTMFNTVYSFNGFDGANPQAGVVLGSDGYLYGTTSNGGSNGVGTVYRVKPDGTSFSVVHHFNGIDGANPQGNVILSSDGFLYGTAFYGGATSNGSIYKVQPDGSSFSTIYNFHGDDGANPQGNLIIGSNGFLYGSTYSGGRDLGGTVFKVNTQGTSFNVLYNFTERGYAPLGRITMSDGFLYGTTTNGGTGWAGTVYRLKLNPEP